jgi:hypothetical protein
MSHFSRIQTRFVDRPFLTQALQDLGFQFEEGSLSVQGFKGQQEMVQILVKLQNSYDIGLRQVDDAFEIIADWAGVRGFSQKDFIQQLTQRYAYRATMSKLEAQGFTLVEDTRQSDGQIHMVLRRVQA